MYPLRFLFLVLLMGAMLNVNAQCSPVAGMGGWVYNTAHTDSVGYLTSISATASFINFGPQIGTCGMLFPGINAPWSGNSNGVYSEVTYTFNKPIRSIDLMIGYVGVNGVSVREKFYINTDGMVPDLVDNSGTCTPWEIAGDSIISPDEPNALSGIISVSSSAFTSLTIGTWSTGSGSAANGGSSYAFCYESLELCTASSDSITISACESYTSPSGNYTWTVPGDYVDTIWSALGCDSVIYIDLDIENVANGVTQTDNVLVADFAGAEYQWLDCGLGYEEIVGQNGQAFEALADGEYAVIIQNGSCVDTSSCFSVVSPSGLSIWNPSVFELYPNPSAGSFAVQLSGFYNNIQASIFDLRGSLIYVSEFNNVSLFELEYQAPPGMYVLQLISEEGVLERSIIRAE